MKRVLAAGVIGAGALGSRHAEKYASMPGVRLAGVADVSLERAARVAAPHGCRATAAYAELLSGVDLVSVAVPTVAHYPVARACLEAGVHVLVEKPIACSLAEADALVALADARGLVLAAGHLERFNPAFAQMISQMAEPRFVRAERLAMFQERGTDVDVVLDLMIHDLDLVLAMIRSEVASVSACGFAVLTERVDIANAHIEFANGAVADLTASRVSRERVRKLRVFGASSYASVDMQEPHVRIERLERGATVTPSEWRGDTSDALRSEIEAFVRGVRDHVPGAVSGREARHALALALEVDDAIAQRAARYAAAPTHA